MSFKIASELKRGDRVMVATPASSATVLSVSPSALKLRPFGKKDWEHPEEPSLMIDFIFNDGPRIGRVDYVNVHPKDKVRTK